MKTIGDYAEDLAREHRRQLIEEEQNRRPVEPRWRAAFALVGALGAMALAAAMWRAIQ